MRKLSLKSKILLSAILLGGGIAGAQTLVNMPKAADPTYNWKGSSDAPLNPNGNLNNKTTEQAEQHFGCSGAADICATGVPTSGSGSNAYIRLD